MNKYFLKLEIKNALEEIEPTLNLDAEDKILLATCLLDFVTYEAFVVKNVKYEIELDVNSAKHEAEIKKYVYDWVKWWWKKYKSRVKVFFGKPKGREFFELGEIRFKKYFTEKEQQDLVSMIVNTLINNGEICFVPLLATNLICMGLGKSKVVEELTLEEKLEFTNEMLNATNELCRKKGTIVNIKPDLSKYKYLDELEDTEFD